MEEIKLFPSHPQPHDGELLSAWLERVAEGNGLSFNALSHHIKRLRPVFDIDRRADQVGEDERLPWEAATSIARRTGLTRECVMGLSLSAFAQALYGEKKPLYSRKPPWILPYRPYVASDEARQWRRYPYCSKCSPHPKEGYVRRIWRLAFVVVCPEHGILLQKPDPKSFSDESSPVEKSLSEEETVEDATIRGDHDLERLLRGQTFILHALRTGIVPENIRSEEEKDLPSAHFFAGLSVLISFIGSSTNGTFLRACFAKRASVSAARLESGRTPFEFRNLEGRRTVMSVISWLLSDWPARYKEVCVRSGLRSTLLQPYRRGRVEETKWLLEEMPAAHAYPYQLDSGENTTYGQASPERLEGLSMPELIELGGPDLEFQLRQVGITPEQMHSAMLTDWEWERVKDIFSSRAHGAGKWKGLVRRRTLFGLILFSIRKETPEAGKFPPILAGRIVEMRSKWTSDGRLEDAFAALGPCGLDPDGLIDWTAERKRLGRRRSAWKASDHYTRSLKGQAADLPSGARLLARRRVFLEGGKCARLRPSYYNLPESVEGH